MFRKKRVYLDFAAAMPVRKVAKKAFESSIGSYGNPASSHTEGRNAKEVLEHARTHIARMMEVKADDVIFTSGATEANNIAIRGLAKPGSHFLYLPSAHASVVETMRSVVEQGVEIEPLPILDGKVDIAVLRTLLRPTTRLISMDAVCGETGTVWNTREVKMSLDKLGAKRPLLHVDASQAVLSEKITRSHFGADIITLDASKIGGMRGIGALIAARIIPLSSILFGGGQERAVRPGTPAPSLALSFSTALAASVAERESFQKQAKKMRSNLVAYISDRITGLYINEFADVAPHILNISLVGRDTDYLVALLDTAGFAVSTRSACETDSEEGSRAVLALTQDQECAKATLRISWGKDTLERDLMRFGEVLVREVAFVDNSNA